MSSIRRDDADAFLASAPTSTAWISMIGAALAAVLTLCIVVATAERGHDAEAAPDSSVVLVGP